MVTTLVQLRSYSNKDGTQSVRIRVIINRVSKYVTLFKIDPKYFLEDKQRISKRHHRADELNELIENGLRTITERVHQLKKTDKPVTIDSVFEKNTANKYFVSYIKRYEKDLIEQNKHTSARKFKNLHSKVADFDAKALAKSIDLRWIKKFHAYIRALKNVKSETTVTKCIKLLKTVLRQAQMDGVNVDIKVLNYKVTTPKVPKPKLTIAELTAIKDSNLAKYNLARDTFMLMYRTRGTRVGSIMRLHHSDIVDNRLIFHEKGRKKKSVVIDANIALIIDRYRGKSPFGYVLPWMDININEVEEFKFSKKIESKTATFNRHLKVIAAACGIRKNLTSHIARHTYAYLALTEAGQDLNTISKSLNHSDVRVTTEYLNALMLENELDDATSQVSNLI